MKIFMTTGGLIWNPSRKIFRKYKDDLVIMCINKSHKENLGGMQIIECDLEFAGMGHVRDSGFDSPYYKALVGKKHELELILSDDESVIVLGDTSIESLYIFKVLQQITGKINLHLWAITPFKFESIEAISEYNAMLEDLSNTRSITLTDPLQMVAEDIKENISLSECVESCRLIIDSLFEEQLRKISTLNTNEVHFYDYHTKEFISVEETTTYSCPLINDTDYEEKLKRIKQPMPRVDGKEICSKLRKLRKAYADANNIPYTFKECHSKGPCAGTCAYCDDELKSLSAEIECGSKEFPQYEIDGNHMISKEEAERLLVGTMGFLMR